MILFIISYLIPYRKVRKNKQTRTNKTHTEPPPPTNMTFHRSLNKFPPLKTYLKRDKPSSVRKNRLKEKKHKDSGNLKKKKKKK